MPDSIDIFPCHLVSYSILLSWITYLVQLPHPAPSLCFILIFPSFVATSFHFPWFSFLCHSSFLFSFMLFSILRHHSTWIFPYCLEAQQTPNTHLWLLLSHVNYSSMDRLVLTLVWKYSTVFNNFSFSTHTSSSIFYMCSTRLELTFSSMTLSIDASTSCTFWCIGWIIFFLCLIVVPFLFDYMFLLCLQLVVVFILLVLLLSFLLLGCFYQSTE